MSTEEPVRVSGAAQADARSVSLAPPNGIPTGCESITPDMVPLVALDKQNIDDIARCVPGGARNIQDIYPLSDLQEGILFHTLMGAHGTYVLSVALELRCHADRATLVRALQDVMARHDTFRTAVLWERLPRPVQVVYRTATLEAGELVLDLDEEPIDQLLERMRTGDADLDLRRAPLMSLEVTSRDHGGRWYALLRVHHLICDHQSLRTLVAEVMALTNGVEQGWVPPAEAYREYVWEALNQQRAAEAIAFFHSKLADVEEPTAPFGVTDVYGDGARMEESVDRYEPPLVRSIRKHSQLAGVGAARLFHAAWALVVAATTGGEDIVFGTVLLAGRLRRSGARRALGLGVNTLPLRLRLSGVTAAQLVQRVDQDLRELSQYEHVSLTTAKKCSGVESAPLFTALLNFRRGPSIKNSAGPGAAAIKVLASGEAWTNYPITVIVDDCEDEISVTVQTDGQISSNRLAGYLRSALLSLVAALERTPLAPALALSVLPRAELEQIYELSNASTPSSDARLIHELFEAQAMRASSAIAATCENHSLTYGELNSRANQLAWYLKRRGIGPDRLVGIFTDRSLEMIVGLLGILKAGGAYLPLDPQYPVERLTDMLADAAPGVVLTENKLRSSLPAGAANVIALDGDWPMISQESTGTPKSADLELLSRHLAYVIYTSGSTGKPKGVMVEHRNVVRLLQVTAGMFEFTERDVWTLFHSIAFDFSVWELWGALVYGGRLIVVPYMVSRSPREFYRMVCREHVTVLNQTPSAFSQFSDAQRREPLEHSLRLVVFGGEAIDPVALNAWVDRNGDQRQCLVNMYGITETTVHVTYKRLLASDLKSPHSHPIGIALADLAVHLLDSHLKPVPQGVTGEIYVGGRGVARGYLNRPELTATRFVSDPFSGEANRRMYRSGDLARWQDGELEYFGRNDDQVKIRGFRIELGEIEAHLAQHEEIKAVRVLVVEDAVGDKQLVAYLIQQNDSPLDLESVRSFLSCRVPNYMVPSAFVILDCFPLTANGKLDKSALPGPEKISRISRRHSPPKDLLEERLCGVWAAVLGLERVGVEDNFFTIGGDSIRSLRVIAGAEAAGIVLGVADLFRDQTIAQLAATLRARSVVESAARRTHAFELLSPSERIQFTADGDLEDAYPLSRLQEGMYFHSELDRDSAIYHNVFSYCLEMDFDRPRLERAIHDLVDRHPMLRAGIVSSCDDRPIQIIHKAVEPNAQFEDLSAMSAAAQDAILTELVEREKFRRFVWAHPPLMRFFVHRRGPRQFQLTLSFHHVIVDGWSIASLLTEMLRDYSSLLTGSARRVHSPNALYRDFIALEREVIRSSAAKECWRSHLAGAQVLPLPRSLKASGSKGRDVVTRTVNFPAHLGPKLQRIASEIGVHLRLPLLAAHVKVMSVISGRSDVLTGVVSNGRLEVEDGERVVGLHLNSAPLRIELAPNSWRELIRALSQVETGMMPHRRYPLAAIQDLIGRSALFETLFNFTQFHVYDNLESVTHLSLQTYFAQTNFSLVAAFSQESGELGVTLSLAYDPAVLDGTQIEHIGGYYCRALEAIAECVDSFHHTSALMDPDEIRKLVTEFNRTAKSWADDRSIAEIYEAQAAMTPEATAVVDGTQALTYRLLNERANQLARFLRTAGVGPDRLVGICMDRSCDMVVAVLGVFKAGGAYVPLDPFYPRERLAYMLSDSKPMMLLTQAAFAAQLPSRLAPVVSLDADWCRIEMQPSDNLDTRSFGPCPRDLAYVIYTSGSTGEPKGVMIERGGVINLYRELDGLYTKAGVRNIGLNASLSFDASVQQLMQIVSGRTVVMIPSEIRRDPLAVLHLLRTHEIEGIDCTPSQVKTWLSAGLFAGECPLRVLLVGGESIDRELWMDLSRCSNVQAYNVYGPTECTVDASIARLCGDASEPHIGSPMMNRRFYILDEWGQVVPIGVAGEIYIGGIGVARGYLNLPKLTAERFISDRFLSGRAATLYRTGDLGRWNPDGTIEYLGRNDGQVKLRGFRIELGEIQAQLLRLRGVGQAATSIVEARQGEMQLVAFIVPADLSHPPTVNDLRASLMASLPEYMVPNAFVMLDRLPLTSNGKLDRAALPTPGRDDYVADVFDPPETELERAVAEIWQETLELERVSRGDNFFRLGGNSLSAMRVIAKVRARMGIDLSVKHVFQNAHLLQLVDVIERTTLLSTSTLNESEDDIDEIVIDEDA